jgi:signal transduction histidine kinase
MLSGRYSRELNLLDQVHVALGSTSKLEDFYVIVASMLVDPGTFGFSRAFVLRYDERTRVFHGRVALGAQSREEHLAFRRVLLEEEARLKEQMEALQAEAREPVAVQALVNLRYHSLWIQLLQGRDEGMGMNNSFQSVSLKRDGLEVGHLLETAAMAPQPLIFGRNAAELQGLSDFVRLPAIAGRLTTKRGLHAVVIADRIFENSPPSNESLYYFHWLLNHAAVTLDNVELVEELKANAQRLQEVDRLKTNFLSIVSHELRTPLTSITGFANLVHDEKIGGLNPSQRDLFRRIMQHAQHLQNMVNDLLEIAEVEAGGMVNVSLGSVDPLAAFENTLPKLEPRKQNKKIAIEPVIRPDQRVPAIYADQVALERIYYHLLDNAVKFIPTTGSITIEFEEKDEHLLIHIRDTGIGISEENLKRIFDYFYQVDFRLERAYGGMGIGLTVVKLLLTATGGQIGVESVLGSGSCFTLEYPLATAPSEAWPDSSVRDTSRDSES